MLTINAQRQERALVPGTIVSACGEELKKDQGPGPFSPFVLFRRP